MDIKQSEDLRICSNCDELSIWSYYEAQKRNDYSFLVYGWDGWPALKHLPIETKEHFDNITNEWAEITKNNKSIQHFELIAEYSDKVTRAEIVGGLLQTLQVRWLKLKEEGRQEYIDELKYWGFLFRKDKPIVNEFKRLKKQWKASLMKIKQLEGEIEQFEGKTEKVELAQIKAKIHRIAKMDIDTKRTSMKEWFYLLEEAINNKAA